MTVRDWISAHASGVPDALTTRVLTLLGAAANAPASQAGSACVEAARRALAELVAAGEHGREIALQLLAIDALTTYAFEHASESGDGLAALKTFASDSAKAVAQLAAARG